MIVLVVGPLLVVAVLVILVVTLTTLENPTPRQLQAQLDSLGRERDIAQYEVARLQTSLAQLTVACSSRRHPLKSATP